MVLERLGSIKKTAICLLRIQTRRKMLSLCSSQMSATWRLSYLDCSESLLLASLVTTIKIKSKHVWQMQNRLQVLTLSEPINHKLQRLDWPDKETLSQGCASAFRMTRLLSKSRKFCDVWAQVVPIDGRVLDHLFQYICTVVGLRRLQALNTRTTWEEIDYLLSVS